MYISFRLTVEILANILKPMYLLPQWQIKRLELYLREEVLLWSVRKPWSHPCFAVANRFIAVTCADPRVIPEEFFGFSRLSLYTIEPSLFSVICFLFFYLFFSFCFPANHCSIYSGAVVVRCAGGRIVDALRSLIVVDGIFPVKTVIIVQHTG